MLTREDDIDVHALRRQGWTLSVIARHLGRDRKTVTRTLDTTQADVLRPLMENSQRLRELTTELATLALQQVRNDPTQPDP